MISIIVVILVHLLGEQRDGVPDEEMRDVQRQRVVDAALAQAPVQRLVVHYVDVVVPDTTLYVTNSTALKIVYVWIIETREGRFDTIDYRGGGWAS